MTKNLLYIPLFMAFMAFTAFSEEDIPAPSAATQEAAAPARSGAQQTPDALIPPPRRPQKGDGQKCAARKAEDKSDEEHERRIDTLKYGITSEVVDLLATLTTNDDPRYVDEVYDMFQKTRSTEVKDKTLSYFAKFTDPCLSDFACTILNEYYDNKTTIVNACLRYAGEVKCKEAIPAIITIIKDGDEKFWQNAMTAMGFIGGSDEAAFLTSVFNDENEEMTVIKKQSLVRALGMIHATDTWDALVEMAENEDENTFVRMYAAEAIGSMEKAESVPVLASLYDCTDPNLREYALKGLANFSSNSDAHRVIIEAVKDAHPRVRTEAINDVGKLSLKDAAPLLVFRAKTDNEPSVKKAAYNVLAQLGTTEGQTFLTGILADQKASDSAKKQASLALLKAGDAGNDAIARAAMSALADNKRKPLRRALASVIAHYDKAAFAPVCKAYLESGDSDSVSLGLDMYQRGKYASAADSVRAIAEAKGNNKGRAMKILGIKDEE